MEKALAHIDWSAMTPELILVTAAALLIVLELLLPDETSRDWLGWVALLAVVGAGMYVVVHFGGATVDLLQGSYRTDPVAQSFKLVLLGGSALILVLSLSGENREGIGARGEYYFLLLTAVLGGSVMTSSADLVTLFVGLELLSISSYILAGIRKQRTDSNEAAWKYVVLGGVSSAFILYGMSFVYGLTGSTNLFVVQQRIVEAYQTGYAPFVLLSLFLMMLGFGFKIAAAPFHMWAPDVYQGSPTSVTAFLAAVSKTAAFALVTRVVLVVYLQLIQLRVWEEIITPLLLVIAGASMIVGNAVALRQTNVKRLMAYSGIAQAGYVLVPLASLGMALFESTLFYLLAYSLITVSVFAVIMVVERDSEHGELSAFAGLYRRSPLVALAMTLLVLSLAGIPVTAGFFGKFYLLINAIATQHFWIAAVMVVTTVVSYFYYFEFIRQMYFRPAPKGNPLAIPIGTAIVIGIGVIGTVGLGLFPNAILHALGQLKWAEVLSIPQTPPGP
ncbi:NADH-quinone oxidoreductase subunit N [Polycladomyces abyssicola]|uniref:NADH-quinone oxidoreductase subunit N n=1 Tax=Polycladomyces abyssicola TaxID=1125966 RepID=A0A8D5UGP2_9BACL|nr:NADH-quinone oxidoreductase subunit N [Polycladomyces abyssicola]BCU83246.1 NADH-quinone oxidoreductase subunit N [Polycladomyces abyssicola]